MPILPSNISRIKRFPGRIGLNPNSATQGVPAAKAANYLRLNSHNRTVFSCNCHPPDLWGLANSSDMRYYIPTRCQSRPTGNTHRLYGEILEWGNSRAADQVVTWYPKYAPGVPGAATELFRRYWASPATLTYGSQIEDVEGALIRLHGTGFAADDNDTKEFEVGLLKVENILPAALHIATCAPNGAPPNANFRPLSDGCTAGAPLRGYNSANKYLGIGDLLHRSCSANYNDDRVTSALASPVFAWGHHHGIFVGADGVFVDTRNIFGDSGTLRMRVHSPFKDASINLRPVIVYSAGHETSMAITNTTGGSGSSTITLPAQANPTLQDFATATGTLTANVGEASEVTVEVTIDSSDGDTHWFILHTIQLWPANEAYPAS
jgi:hypothetical protein